MKIIKNLTKKKFESSKNKTNRRYIDRKKCLDMKNLIKKN